MEQVLTNQNVTNINQPIQENIDLTTKYIMENIDKTLIMFVNPISGNQEGKIILNIANHYITKEKYKLIDFQYLVTYEKYEPIKVVFFELINKEDCAKGQLLLRHCYERCKLNKEMGLPENLCKVRTLIGGGDGTVLSMVESFIKTGTDINYCIFGHVPLGTGNDLANSLGFSDHIDISENNINDLYLALIRYYKAKFGKIDVWKMDLELDLMDGQILVNTKHGKKPLKDDNGNIIKRYIRTFINYVSLGYDARVGYNFDSKRTNSRNKNKCIYFIEGAKKLFCKKTISVQGFIDTFTVYESLDNSINQDSFFSENDNQNNLETFNQVNNPNYSQSYLGYGQHKIKFKFMSKNTFKRLSDKIVGKCLVMEGHPCSIIFQNIVNYMSGVRDMWGKGEERLAIGVQKGTENENIKYTEKLKHMASMKQRLDDKMLEVFTFDNGFETGFEKIIRGLAKKIYHGRGPMEIKFLETPKYTKNDTEHRIYLNLDGEYFHVVKPIILRIQLNRDLCNGQLSFLVGNL